LPNVLHLTAQIEFSSYQRISGLEIRKPGLNQPQHDTKDHRGRNPEQKRSICRFERPQQSPGRRHDEITITQGRVVDRGVVKGGSEVCKFSTDYEQRRPQCDLHKVRQRRVKYCPSKNTQINPGHADMTQTFFSADKVYRGPDWHQVDNDRAGLGDHANREGRQDRNAMTLYHSTPDCSLDVACVP
jgi:hypothetical protein